MPAIAVDGKAVRGAIGEDGQVPYLLAAATHEESVVLAERLIGAKTNEVPEFAPLLRGLAQVRGRRVRVHHGRRAHRPRPRPLITSELLAHYVMIVKQNTQASTTRSTPWTGRTPRSPTKPSTSGTAGETSAPSGSSTPPPISGSPRAAQVFLVERYTTRTVRKRPKGSRRYKKVQIRSAVAVLGVTSLSAREAAPEHLAGYVRRHWSIENKIHWVRDVTLREDASQSGTAPDSG